MKQIFMWPFKKKKLKKNKFEEIFSLEKVASTKAQQKIDDLQRELAFLYNRFDLIRSATSDGLWDMEVNLSDLANERNVFWWSDQFRALLGYKDENDFPNYLGSWSRLLHPDDFGPTMDAFSRHLLDKTGRTPYDVQYRLKCRNGAWRSFAARGETLRKSNGVPLRVAGSLRCIEDLLSSEKELNKTLIRFELSREMITDGIWDLEVIAGDPVNPRNAFWWSRQFRHLLGFENEEEFPNIMDSWASRLHPEDKQRSLDAFVAHLVDKTGRTRFDVEYRLQCKDLKYRWFRARGQTQRARDGTPLRAVGVLCDIHTNKLAEEAHVEQIKYQARLETSLKNITAIVENIDLIARQTNLIALNAAIEAARAGPVGAGFSVIANEIRQLSTRTSDATRDVSNIQRELSGK